MSKLSVAPIQFTVDELRMIDAGCQQFLAEWYNGYQSQTRILRASSVLKKVRDALASRTPEKAAVSPQREDG